MSMSWGWLFVVAVGPLILGLAIGYALARRRNLTVEEKRERHEAIERLYEE